MKSDEATGVGYLHVVLRDQDGSVLAEQFIKNMITTVGDQYMIAKAAVGVGSYAGATPSPVNGMKLGTGTAAAAKSGNGSYITTGSYISGSNVALDSGFPTIAAATGTDAGWEICYQVTWPAGTATNSAIAEIEVCTDQSSDAGHSAGQATIARALLTAPINKTSTNALTVTWYHGYRGSTS